MHATTRGRCQGYGIGSPRCLSFFVLSSRLIGRRHPFSANFVSRFDLHLSIWVRFNWSAVLISCNVVVSVLCLAFSAREENFGLFFYDSKVLLRSFEVNGLRNKSQVYKIMFIRRDMNSSLS